MRTSLIAVTAVLGASLALSACFGAPPSPGRSVSPGATAPGTEVSEPRSSPTASPDARESPGDIPTATPTAIPTASSFVSYTVRAGDSLGSIARTFETTWQSLVYWNREVHPSLHPDDPTYDPNRIEVGWALRVRPGIVVAFDPPPPLVPTAAPTPAATATPVTGSLVTNGPLGTNRVALTLDMGGRIGEALAIMTWLRDNGVAATIFMTGAMADSDATDAGRQVLARVDARPDLFDLGNHSYSHPHMTAMPAAAMVDEIQRTETAIARHAASSPKPFFRPPYGESNATLVSAAASVGYRYSVMWDIDTIDWKPISDGGPTAAQIVDKVVSRAQGGSIVLMHLGGFETLDALPGIVAGLRARGLEPVTLGTMFGG